MLGGQTGRRLTVSNQVDCERVSQQSGEAISNEKKKLKVENRQSKRGPAAKRAAFISRFGFLSQS
jgi:hypothetical protein